MLEERLKLKIQTLRRNYVSRYKKIVLGISVVMFLIVIVFLLTVGIKDFGLQGLPVAMLKAIMFFVLGDCVVLSILLREYRCLNSKTYNYHKAYVRNKKQIDEHMEFVGVENKMRKFPKEFYVLLDDEEKYTMAKSWTYRDIRVGETYLLAFTGKKRTKKSVIVCAIKLEN